MMSEPSDKEIFEAVIAADEEGLLAGENPKQRSLQTIFRAMKRLGFESFVFAGTATHPTVERIHNIIKQLYRPEDIAVGGIHMGTFMFRDVFARISVALAYGTVRVEPLRHTNMNELQLRWLRSRPEDYNAFHDQFADIWDFGWGLLELGSTRSVGDECKNFMGLAHFQLQAAAAIVTGAYDFRGAVQSSLIATELALKGGLAASKLDLKALKNLGHDLGALTAELEKHEPKLDGKRITETIGKFPSYVPNRYSPNQPDRRATGHIVMGAQYVAAEVMRQLTDRNFRSAAKDYPARSYPPL